MIEHLTPTQRVIAWRFCEGRCVSLNEIIDMLYGNDPDGGPNNASNVIYTQMISLRRKFEVVGIEIENVHGRGYRVDDTDRLRDVLAEEIARRFPVMEAAE